jgi:hypothetical protein
MAALLSLSPPARRYLSALKLTAVYITSDGNVAVSRDPVRAGALTAWWVPDRRTAEAIVLRAAGSSESPAAAVESAAVELGVVLTEHALAVARAEKAAARIVRGRSAAQARGDLHFFNAEYKRLRAEAAAAGKSFMSYGQARARLQKAIAANVTVIVTTDLIALTLKR